MRRALLPLSLAAALNAAPAGAFEWDDGRGVTPFKLHTSRHYISADQQEAREWPQRRSYPAQLAAALRAQMPASSGLGAGRVTVEFRIDANGRVDQPRVVFASSAAHGEAALRLVSHLRAPPPPGGYFLARQSVVFH